MPQAARENDTTTGTCSVGAPCCSHSRTGTCKGNGNTVIINGRKAVKVGDVGPTNCPHGGSFAPSQGSATVFINGAQAARLGDPTPCQVCGLVGNISSGSGDVLIGG